MICYDGMAVTSIIRPVSLSSLSRRVADRRSQEKKELLSLLLLLRDTLSIKGCTLLEDEVANLKHAICRP